MAELTRVPLRPLKQGVFARLWLCIAAAVFAGSMPSRAAEPEGVPVDPPEAAPEQVSVTTITPGLGASPGPQDVAFVRYRGMLEDGTVFDESQDLPVLVPGLLPEGTPMPLTEVIPGFQEGIVQMQKGGKYRLSIPSGKAYGPQSRTDPETGVLVIPANADLIFEIELIDFMSSEDFYGRAELYMQASDARRVTITTITPGLGASPARQDMVFIRYRGMLEDGTEFDKSQDLPLPPAAQSLLPEGTPMSLAEVIPGFRAGITQMQKGGKYRLLIPSDLAYGPEGITDPRTGVQTIPPGADLIFEIELIDFMNDEDFNRRVQLARQALQTEQEAAEGEQGQSVE
jgi:FKBP-type peptidyl-prolyl cis-trans isomerase FkpA